MAQSLETAANLEQAEARVQEKALAGLVDSKVTRPRTAQRAVAREATLHSRARRLRASASNVGSQDILPRTWCAIHSRLLGDPTPELSR